MLAAPEREFLLMRILTGKLKFKDGIYIVPPTVNLLYDASEIYHQIYTKSLAEGIMSDEDAKTLLINQDFWSEQKEIELNKTLPGHIEYWKEELYKAYLRTERKKEVRKYLAAARAEYGRLGDIRRSYEHMTCLGVANYAKLQFIIEKCTRRGHKPYDWAEYTPYDLMSYYQRSFIPEDDVRELSHNNPWDVMWSVGKKTKGVFGKPAIKMTFDQHRLVMWTTLYDNVNQQPNPPPADVIQDDDMLDGWLSLKRKEKLSSDNRLTDNERINKAQEIYVPATNIEDAQRIDDMNSQYSKMIKKQRYKAIDKRGELTEANLPDVKQELFMEMNKRRK